jgi:hypothetical protein
MQAKEALLLLAAVLPGILCHMMFQMGAPLYVIAPFIAYFGFQGIKSMQNLRRSHVRVRV